MAADINAIGILFVIAATVFLVVRYGSVPKTKIARRFLSGLLGLLFSTVPVILFGLGHKCRAGEPLAQWLIPCFCIFAVSLFVSNRRLADLTVVTLVIISWGLSIQFLKIIHNDGYAGAHFGGLLGTPDKNESFKPSRGDASWNSWLTGIYICRRLKGKLTQYLSDLETLELDPHKYESHQNYHDAVFSQMDGWLKNFKNPEELRILFWECHSIHMNKPEAPQEEITWIDPHFESLNLILYRLAEIQTQDAAKVLVNLWSDPKAGWGAGPSLGANDAVVKCGRLALPYLRRKKDTERNPDRLIKLIESGAKSGF